MKKINLLYVFLLAVPFSLISQETAKDSVVDKPERAAFESSYIIDMPTSVLPIKNTLEVQMEHRFGTVSGANFNMIGLWAPANIRIGFTYSLNDRLTIGYGTTKLDRLQDFNWKIGILRQTRSGKVPVNVTYFGNFTIDARRANNFYVDQHRYSNFHQLIISRRFNSNLSLQLAPSISHYNLVPQRMRNDVVALSLGGRYKISPQTAILIDYTHPFIHHLDGESLDMDPRDGLGLGVEFRTSSHAFQIFLTSYQGIVPQKNVMFNQNDPFPIQSIFNSNGGFLIGFNITRLYNF